MFVRHPVWLQNVTRPGSETFALVFALESLSRAVIAAVIPIQLLRVFGNNQDVSAMYFGASVMGLLVSLALPLMVGFVPRRWIYTFGALCFVVAALLLMSDNEISLALGMVARVVGLVSTTICMNLYILDHIARKDLSRSEPTRLFYSALSWTIGPVLGAVLLTWGGIWAPFALSGLCALIMLSYFWCLRLGDNSPIIPAKNIKNYQAQNPISNIRRFIQQPRLNMSWLLAFCRAGWWSMFFIYTPLYAVESGLGEVAGGLIVSAGNACLFILPFWGRIARRIGARKVFLITFVWSGLGTALVFFVSGYAFLGAGLGAGCLFLAALGMSFQDAVGNLPFMVAVRPRERAAMTSVFTTYRDASELVPSGIFSILLRSYELSVVFLVMGGTMIAVGSFSRKLHPRLGRDRPKRLVVEELAPVINTPIAETSGAENRISENRVS